MINTLEKIEKESKELTPDDKLKLVEIIVHQLREPELTGKKPLDLSKLYGLGKGLWEKDAQDYVNQLRENRI